MFSTTIKAFVAGLSILAVVSASSSSTASKQSTPSSNMQSFLINDNFETYPQGVVSQTPVDVTAVNTYNLLFFNTVLINETQPLLVGVPCHTPPTCTGFTLRTGLVAGLLTPGASAPALGAAYVTSKYRYSPISYFQPYAFYYGCAVADANSAASLPVSCNITATGTNSQGKTIYNQVFSYQATGAVLQTMTLGFFDQGWTGLQVQTLNFAVTNNLTTIGLFDNLIVSVFGPQNAAITIDF